MTAVAASRSRVLVRRDTIVERLVRLGRVEVGELAEVLEVTEETIRRDLRALEGEHLLRRAHGGAISVPRAERSSQPHGGRAAMAAAVAGLISDGDAVYLGPGPVCEDVAALLGRRSGVQLITGSAPVALTAVLSDVDARVHAIGGNVAGDGSLSGMWAREQLAGLEVDFSVVQIEGVAPDGQLLASDPEDAAVQSAALAAARSIVVIAERDSLKGSGHVKYAALADADHIVVGPGMGEVDLQRLTEADVDLLQIESDTES